MPTIAGATKKQILSLHSNVGSGGDVPPLRGTTHLEIWFIHLPLISHLRLTRSLGPDSSASLCQASMRPGLGLRRLQRWQEQGRLHGHHSMLERVV